MNIDRATLDFLEALNRDQSLQHELAATLEGAPDRLQKTVEFATAKGYAVTAEGLAVAKEAIAAAAQGTAEGELSDEALDSVAGGFNPQPEPPGTTSSSYTSLTRSFNKQVLW